MKFPAVPLSRSTFCKRKGQSGVKWNDFRIRRVCGRLQVLWTFGGFGMKGCRAIQQVRSVPPTSACNFGNLYPGHSIYIYIFHQWNSISHKTYRISRPLPCGWTSKPCSKHGETRIVLDGGISTSAQTWSGPTPTIDSARGMRRADSRRDLGKSWTWNPTRSTRCKYSAKKMHGTSCVWLQTSHSSSRALHRNCESHTRTSPLPSPTASWCSVQLMDHTLDGSTTIFIKAQSCENHLAVTREILAAMGNGC